ncbi:MAG: hypothetical protein HOM68_13705 [Gemmatimonadetes bacterium]|nr:hypothetical protein [Gemmatimonadota bacterium]MBT5142673.1 hypothetical protein [Gemmatimonadota bacterium]MBT5587649.1 hypothetical protein [Gemmatimonadota bacterium]MBT5960571.1 hypothetical protein [Gemmatimonadota bacterium]MBT7456235.1 hypothetical protein [Gemmatimonadota bacterium]
MTPSPLDGLGAATFVLAAVTAFYDAVRLQATQAGDDDWFTYPDFYTFQLSTPLTDYGYLDIWPGHKNLQIQAPLPALAEAVIDRAPHRLLLPASYRATPATDMPPYHRVHLASLRRTIRQAYVYEPQGAVADADLHVTCPSSPVDKWIAKVCTTVDAVPAMQWPDSEVQAPVTQSFRQIGVEEAIERLRACEGVPA